MSIFGSFYSAISGLNTNSQSMSVIGDNLANMNTIGFKRSRASFQDLMAYPVIGVGTESYVGRGSMVQSVDQVMTQGSFVGTGNGLDLAIQGNGFFIVKDGANNDQTNYFTRAGQFSVDKNGYMVNGSGLRLQGYMADNSGDISSVLGDMNLNRSNSPANATTTIDMTANVNSEEDPIATGFDINDPENTSHFNTSVTVYDSLGAAHDVTVYFTKTADGTWDYNAVVSADDSASGVAEIQGSGTLNFDNEGRLTQVTTTQNQYSFSGGSVANQAITFDFGDPTADGGTGLSGLTQFASTSSVTYQGQDGYTTGDLTSVLVDSDGIITGTFSNGENLVLGQVGMADFAGTGLKRMGGNLWKETTQSGEALIGAANSGTRGAINSSTLEQSNVDMAEEFVDMIVAQRGYQANSRTITTADALLQEALQIKR